MTKNDKKGLRARLDDIYKWSVKSGVAVATPNSLKVQWDKVIEELNETLLHVRFDERENLVDDIGDVFISFINLLNMDPKKKKGVFEQNDKRMVEVVNAVKLKPFAVETIGKSYILDAIFSAIKEAHRLKKTTLKNHDLTMFLGRLTFIYGLIKDVFNLKTSLRNCIYSSYLEIQGRRYEIRVR